MKATLPDSPIDVPTEPQIISRPFPIKRALTLSNAVMGFSCSVVKGLPGVGFGMTVTVTDGGLMEITHVSSSIGILPIEVNGKKIGGAEVKVGDIIVEVDGVSTVGKDTKLLLDIMKKCKIGSSVTLGLERLGSK
jgi:hypothetical protein